MSDLDITHLNEVEEALTSRHFLSTKWFKLGLKLGLHHTTLTVIEKQHKDDESRCLIECLSSWLNKTDEVLKNGGATWKALATALNKMGETTLSKYIQSLEQSEDTMMAVSDESQNRMKRKLDHSMLDEDNVENETKRFKDRCISITQPELQDDTISDESQNRMRVKRSLILDEKPKMACEHSEGEELIEVDNQITNIDTKLESACSSSTGDVVLNFQKPPRRYQLELIQPGLNEENYIICAPTGSGKTLMAALIIKHHLEKKQKSQGYCKVLFVVKTQQLAWQQKNKLKEYLGGVTVVEITGETEGSSICSSLPSVDIIVCTSGKLYSELESKYFEISLVTLLIMDECHHTTSRDPYAGIMEHYLLQKKQGPPYPHIVGMTASPGAGRGKNVALPKAIEHQLKLCAHLDATSGIKYVKENVDELKQYMPQPVYETHTLHRRTHSDKVILILRDAIDILEKMLPVPVTPMYDRCSLSYLRSIKNELDAASTDGIDQQRDQISILRQLEIFSVALHTYADFELRHLMDVLNNVEIMDEKLLNDIEKHVQALHLQVIDKLSREKGLPNPLLVEAANVLRSQYLSKPGSKGLFFVHDIKHTKYVTDWITSHPELKEIIQPSPISGYSRKGTSKNEQLEIIDKFRSGAFNLLVSTSVLEEGLDILECNIVIRFQPLTNEIAEVQAQGRARAEESSLHTIVVSQSHTHHNHLTNACKKDIANAALKYQVKNNSERLVQLQEQILYQRSERIKAATRKQWNAVDVEIRCKKCNILACKATDVSKFSINTESSPHYIVPSPIFMDKTAKTMPRKNREPAEAGGFSRPYKIGCRNCNEEWGVWGRWKGGIEYPLLKCETLIFANNKTKERRPYKQWKSVPFDILFHTEYIEQDSDTEST